MPIVKLYYTAHQVKPP